MKKIWQPGEQYFVPPGRVDALHSAYLRAVESIGRVDRSPSPKAIRKSERTWTAGKVRSRAGLTLESKPSKGRGK